MVKNHLSRSKSNQSRFNLWLGRLRNQRFQLLQTTEKLDSLELDGKHTKLFRIYRKHKRCTADECLEEDPGTCKDPRSGIRELRRLFKFKDTRINKKKILKEKSFSHIDTDPMYKPRMGNAWEFAPFPLHKSEKKRIIGTRRFHRLENTTYGDYNVHPVRASLTWIESIFWLKTDLKHSLSTTGLVTDRDNLKLLFLYRKLVLKYLGNLSHCQTDLQRSLLSEIYFSIRWTKKRLKALDVSCNTVQPMTILRDNV